MKATIKRLHYRLTGRIPWTWGYSEYKWTLLGSSLSSATLLDLFRNGFPLPEGYGVGVDERIVEYPWVFSHIPERGLHLLDAGSALNFPRIISHPLLSNKRITIATLAPETHCFYSRGISYVFEDLRNLPFKDNSFDFIVCMSSLEHVGMDNTKLYTSSEQYLESNTGDFRLAVREMRRVLRPNGALLVTVPFGRYESFGWFQVFDRSLVREVINSFMPSSHSKHFYAYSSVGWSRSEEHDCSEARYHDVHKGGKREPNGAAAAWAVCCLELVK